jgi:hypothetical protein
MSLTIKNQQRGSGKTTECIELLKKDKGLKCIVPYLSTKNFYPKEVRGQLIARTELLNGFTPLARVSQVIIDEGFIYSPIEIAQLYYDLGYLRISVVSYGTVR